MTNHLARHAGITNDPDQDPTLILFDGHKSHVRLTLTNVVRQRNVTLFLLPPHITQPLDVSIFGPFKNMYYRECSSYMQQNPGATVTKYEIVKLSSKPYLKAMSPDNLVSSFRKTGIFPLKPEIFDTMPESTAPATIYAHDETQPTECAEQTGGVVAQLITDDKQNKENIGPSDFFKNKTIREESVKKIKRKFVPPFLAGNLLKESNIQILESYEIKKQKLEKETKCEKKTKGRGKTPSKSKGKSTATVCASPKPGTSGAQSKTSGPIPVDTCSSDDNFTDDEEVCCICNKWQPEELSHMAGISFVNWGQCDICGHWTHLKFCSQVKVLRRGSEFKCPHCI